MALLPDGRHAIPFSNSNAKCLLENWVEERAVKDLDAEKAKQKSDLTSTAQQLKDGHDGLLTTATCSRTDDLTTHLESYKPRQASSVRQRGARSEFLESMLYEKARKEMEEEEAAAIALANAAEMRSVTSKDFGIDDFVPMKPAPTAPHDYVSEQPVTIWTELRDRVHGVSQSKSTFDSPFRRNTAFSRPIAESWEPEHVKPYEADHVPNM